MQLQHDRQRREVRIRRSVLVVEPATTVSTVPYVGGMHFFATCALIVALAGFAVLDSACGGSFEPSATPPGPEVRTPSASFAPDSALPAATADWRRLTSKDARQLEARSERRPPEEIQKIIQASYGTMRACYERGLSRNKDLSGLIMVRLRIEPDGAVSSAEEAPAGTPVYAPDPKAVADQVPVLADAEVRVCVVKAFTQLKFAAAGVTEVTYPIKFHRNDGRIAPVVVVAHRAQPLRRGTQVLVYIEYFSFSPTNS